VGNGDRYGNSVLLDPRDPDPANRYKMLYTDFGKDVYFCLNQILRARGETVEMDSDLMHIELMISRDGLRRERPFRREPFIASEDQAFSNGGIFTNSTPVFLEDEIRFYYAGYNSGALGGCKGLTDPGQQSGH
jgi:hypothetical protein